MRFRFAMRDITEHCDIDEPGRPDTTRAEQLLGWGPEIVVREGLRRTIVHYTPNLGEVAAGPGPAGGGGGKEALSDAT